MQTRVAHHLAVGLMPANAYTDQVARIMWQNAPTEVALDPRLTQFVRKTTTDDDGNFSFGHVAPGSYYVFCRFTGRAAKRCSISLMIETRDYLNEQTVTRRWRSRAVGPSASVHGSSAHQRVHPSITLLLFSRPGYSNSPAKRMTDDR